jgi:hypothetical protein
MGLGPSAGSAQQQAIANALGMSLGDLVAARQSGKSVAELAQERNVELQVVMDAAAAQFRATVEAAVTAGRLSRAQADALLVDIETRIRDQFNTRTAVGPGYGYQGW